MVGLKDEPLEWIRDNLNLSGANAFTTKEIQLPFIPDEDQTMFIHRFEVEFTKFDAGVHGDHIYIVLANDTAGSELFINQEATIAKVKLEMALVTSGMHIYKLPIVERFDPPMMYVKPTIWVVGGSSGQAALVSFQYRIGYTLDKISKNDFIDALLETR